MVDIQMKPWTVFSFQYYVCIASVLFGTFLHHGSHGASPELLVLYHSGPFESHPPLIPAK